MKRKFEEDDDEPKSRSGSKKSIKNNEKGNEYVSPFRKPLQSVAALAEHLPLSGNSPGSFHVNLLRF